MVEYGFTENVDFVSFTENTVKPQGGRPSTDHAIKLDMAKELSMIQRNEKGKQARGYFIRVEKEYNSPERIMARGLIIAQKTIEEKTEQITQLHTRIEEMRPKEIFADAVSVSGNTVLVGELAKILKQNGIDIGQNRLFEYLRENGYLIKRNGTDYNMPSQYSMELGLFEIKESTIMHSDGHTTISKTPKVTGKGQIYFVNHFKSKSA
jgi:anti-repressor protein